MPFDRSSMNSLHSAAVVFVWVERVTAVKETLTVFAQNAKCAECVALCSVIREESIAVISAMNGFTTLALKNVPIHFKAVLEKSLSHLEIIYVQYYVTLFLNISIRNPSNCL